MLVVSYLGEVAAYRREIEEEDRKEGRGKPRFCGAFEPIHSVRGEHLWIFAHSTTEADAVSHGG